MESDYWKEKKFDVLIADDSEDARTLVQIALQCDYLNFRACKDGEEAIAQCELKLPDFAILDVLMPGKSGIEVCSWIKANSEDVFIPVVLLTCQAELADKVHGLNCGADEYITKPFSVPELEARIRALLRIKDLTDQLRETKDLLREKEKQLVATQVSGAAAHELGQPLTAMLLNCELLTRLSQEHPDFIKTLWSIQQQCRVMRDILHQLHQVREYRTMEYAGDLEILALSTTSR